MDESLTIDFDPVSRTLYLFFGKREFTVWHPVDDDGFVLIGRSEETGRITGVMVEQFPRDKRMDVPLRVDARLTIELPKVEDNQLERLATENPELLAKCENAWKERQTAAVAESRAKYNIDEKHD